MASIRLSLRGVSGVNARALLATRKIARQCPPARGPRRRMSVSRQNDRTMAIVVRLGPLPLQHRRGTRLAELERILGTAVQLIKAVTAAELFAAIRLPT